MLDEIARLSYIQNNTVWEVERPCVVLAETNHSGKRTNVEYEKGPRQRIIDVRGSKSKYRLEKHGFMFMPWQSPSIDWCNKAEIDTLYILAMKKLVTDLLLKAPERIELFHWRLRHARSINILDAPGTQGEPQMTRHSPARVVHVDQSPTGVIERIHRLFGQEADSLISKYRIQVLNIWKPIIPIVRDMPLAVCDGRLVTSSDLIEVDYHLDDYISRTLIAKYSDAYQFYYLNRMTENEVCVFKIYDSDVNAEVKCVPHAAFCHTVCPLDQPPRQSIEVRMLVLTEKE